MVRDGCSDCQAVLPVPREIWRSVIAADPDAMPSQSPEWIDAVCAGGLWQDVSRLYVSETGRRIVLPLVRIGPGPLARLASPRRGWGYGGLIAEGGVSAEDVVLVSRDLEMCRKLSLWLRPNPLHARLWDYFSRTATRVPAISHIVDLNGGPDAVRSRFHASAKKGIRTAEKAGVRVETGYAGDLLPVFYELAIKARARWARCQHEPVWLAQLRGRARDSLHKWRTIARHLGPGLQITVASHHGKPVAAGIVLQSSKVGHGTLAAMDPEMRQLGASHLLNWVVLQNACTAGARSFHMGESATLGAAAFKESFGARRYVFEELRLERLPFSAAEASLRSAVKAIVGFRGDGPPERANNGGGPP
ncbi:GNAT family N-acetyltransferase [Devosia nitrariae]|uniref:BioF2-like acetyltransferase domain-containing protein n=1 Tax=Devosia nitrariae TaxID=2071872 RepID=A0ABQ5W141_9HYPH|nr:GNAT family N-acetyltransferase [Devosia nitrariae]GLQ53553.1 hypothetical protein GCM10010862_08120 [Devosia nitrariae]